MQLTSGGFMPADSEIAKTRCWRKTQENSLQVSGAIISAEPSAKQYKETVGGLQRMVDTDLRASNLNQCSCKDAFCFFDHPSAVDFATSFSRFADFHN
jgi:hypothetical protein